VRCTGLRVGRARPWLNLTILHVVWCAAASSFSSCGVCHQWINGLLSADLFFFPLFVSLLLKKLLIGLRWYFGIYDLIIFFLIFYFCPWLFNKSFISFQFSPSILICNKLCFSIGLFFISYFFTWPFYIYIYIFFFSISTSNPSLFCVIIFNLILNFFLFLLELIFSSI
jgi:hypothetical protein